MADEMARNELREMLTAFEGRLNDRFAEVVNRMDEGFTRVDQHLAGVDQRLAGVDERLAGIDERLAGIDERLAGVDGRFDGVDGRLDGLTNGQHAIESALAAMDVRLSNGIAELGNSMSVQFEKSQADMKLALEAVQILDERMDRRFDEQGASQKEQIDLLKSVVQR